jgi:uncharacterized protein (DUF2235 family)
MPKNIVICCDGTGNEFSNNNSNVVKLYSLLKQYSQQITYYHPGVGTMGSKNALSSIGQWWTKIIGLAFGYGISENIADAYQFLMRNYEEGDNIFVFGFSRGAYTARALCGLLKMFGLLTRGNEGLIPYAIRLAKRKKPDFKLIFKFQDTFARPCKTHFLGVWDTVASVGWIYNAVHFPYTTKNPDLNVVRHSISIDERRAFFRQDLFSPEDADQDIIQHWFGGVHCDVGGGYSEPESGLSKIPLKWILDEAKDHGLLVDEQKELMLFSDEKNFAKPSPEGIMHKSLHGWWWIAEIWPKVHSKPVMTDGKTAWKKTLRINLARPRYIDEKTVQLDDSVKERMNSIAEYRPKNLRTFWPS